MGTAQKRIGFEKRVLGNHGALSSQLDFRMVSVFRKVVFVIWFHTEGIVRRRRKPREMHKKKSVF